MRDFGFGLPPEDQDRAVEKFYWVPQHGGSVEVRSEAGKGSTFSILLPLDH